LQAFNKSASFNTPLGIMDLIGSSVYLLDLAMGFHLGVIGRWQDRAVVVRGEQQLGWLKAPLFRASCPPSCLTLPAAWDTCQQLLAVQRQQHRAAQRCSLNLLRLC
jgi:hypothetical protein